MRRPLLAWALALTTVAAAGCKIGGGETTTTTGAACASVGSACAGNADCCSYGCQAGLCAPNPVDGGTCRTTDDCAFFRLCKSGACTTPPPTGMCRDDADVCTSDFSCCSGNCVGAVFPAEGHCRPNHAPTAAFTVSGMDPGGNVPYHAGLTLQNGSADVDGDGLVYTWSLTLVPPDSIATLSSTTASSPTFTPDLVGDYAVQLTVTDGPPGQPGRLTASVSHAFHAVNLPPVVNAGADRTASRNVPLALSGTASDSDGDPLTCTWRATPPGGGADVVLADPSPCSGTFAATFTCSGTYVFPDVPVLEGVWTITLAATDGPNSVGSTAHVGCVNDPPVANAGLDQVWNLGATVPENPTVPLTGASTDPNGDAPWSWQWTLATVPPGSALVPGAVLSDAQAASFVPDVTGRFVAQVKVCDRPSSCATDTMNVDVYRHIQELGDGRVVNASDHAHGANRIAMAGPDPGNPAAGKVWLRDPSGVAAEVSASLDGVPDTLAVTAAGDWAVAGNNLWLWVVKLSVAPPTVTRVSNAVGALGSIALAGTEAIVFPRTGSTFFRHFTYTTATSSTVLTDAGFLGNVGRVDAAGANLYGLETGTSPRVTRYLVTNKGGFGLTWFQSEFLPVFSPASDLWVSADGAHLFISTGDIQATASLTSTGATLGLSPWWVDSLADGQAAALGADRLSLYSTSLTHTTDDVLPPWGVAGVGHSVVPDGGFIRLDPLDATKTLRWVLVHANGTAPLKSGIVAYP
jgi:hypothetical protein